MQPKGGKDFPIFPNSFHHGFTFGRYFLGRESKNAGWSRFRREKREAGPQFCNLLLFQDPFFTVSIYSNHSGIFDKKLSLSG